MRPLTDDVLESATLHLVGQSRAFLLQLDSVRQEIGSLHDARAVGLVEAIGRTLDESAQPGTLRDVEQEASELLRQLRAGDV